LPFSIKAHTLIPKNDVTEPNTLKDEHFKSWYSQLPLLDVQHFKGLVWR